MLGYNRIPDEWKSGIPKLADTKFAYTQVLVQRDHGVDRGARAQGDRARGRHACRIPRSSVPLQEPKAPKLEQWAVDAPTERLEATSGAWTWSAGWTAEPEATAT